QHSPNFSVSFDCEPSAVSDIKAFIEQSTILKRWTQHQIDEKTKSTGFGAIGNLPVSKPLDSNTFFDWISDRLSIENFRFSGRNESIKRVAVCGGSGSQLTRAAMQHGA